MTECAHEFDRYAFSRQPDYDERAFRRAFAKAVPLRTVVVYCYDPRATGIPAAVAREFGDVFPGKIVRGDTGKKIASTTTLFEVVVAGGRAIDALRSVTVAQHLFGIERVVVVHHTYCGATSFTADGIVEAYAREQGTDIASLYPGDSICITDYVSSLTHDVRLIRMSPGTPRRAAIYGYMYDIDAEALSLVVEDKPASAERGLASSGRWS
ncbi:MAG TPA: carbonic anhydrase [Candidatus Eisenbacteria bacterium]|nr:carbonic anhydrase [Candidatus Eisenbacteria bacterium]